MKKFQYLLFLIVITLWFVSVPSLGQEKPVCELIDHSRGIKITTFSDNWSNNVSRFGIKMIYNPGFSRLEIDKAFMAKKTADETIASHLEVAKKNDKAEILSEEIKLSVGGVEAKGFSFVVLKSRETFVRTWFKKGDTLFEVEIQAKEKHYEEFMKSCQKIFDALKFLDEQQVETVEK